jgi:hypothetical protein
MPIADWSGRPETPAGKALAEDPEDVAQRFALRTDASLRTGAG